MTLPPRLRLSAIALWALSGCGASPVVVSPAVTVTSNALRADYAGSDTCRDCHVEIYTAWQDSPMHGMTRSADRTVVQAPFDGGTFRFKGDVATFERVGATRYVRLAPASGPPLRYKVTKVLGGRQREDFVGLQVDETAAAQPVEGPTPGGGTVSSGEARDFLLGGCSQDVPAKAGAPARAAMACTDCHDPHAKDTPAALGRFDGPQGAAVCGRCHAGYDTPAAVRAHTHHDPGGPGSVCLNCHMVRKNGGLDYRLTRYHRIGSPTDANRVERDRPLECAVCHGDKSVESLVSTMESWWQKRYDRAALRALYGDSLDVGVLEATLARGRPHEQLTAESMAADQHLTGDADRPAPDAGHEPAGAGVAGRGRGLAGHGEANGDLPKERRPHPIPAVGTEVGPGRDGEQGETAGQNAEHQYSSPQWETGATQMRWETHRLPESLAFRSSQSPVPAFQ